MRALLLLSTALLAACSSAGVENGVLNGRTQFAGDSRIDSMVELEAERISYTASDLAVYQVEVVNRREDALRCEYRARWFDGSGIEVGDAVRTWVPIFLPGRSSYPIRSTARSADAVRCVVEVRLSE